MITAHLEAFGGLLKGKMSIPHFTSSIEFPLMPTLNVLEMNDDGVITPKKVVFEFRRSLSADEKIYTFKAIE